MSRFDENLFKESVVSRNNNISIIDTSIKFKYFKKSIVKVIHEREFDGMSHRSWDREIYEETIDFMKRITNWINENNIKPVSMFPVDNEKGFVIFYY